MNQYSLVVAGNMNPAIHHPWWYVSIGAITQAEADLANSSPMSVGQIVSQFRIGDIQVVCNPSQWSMISTKISDFPGFLKVAEKVFSALGHTPVSAFGMNFQEHHETSLPDVTAVLVKKLTMSGLYYLSSPPLKTTVTTVQKTHQGQVTLLLEPSTEKSSKIFVSVFRHFDIPSLIGDVTGTFDLAPLMSSKYEEINLLNTDLVAKILSSLQEEQSGV